MRWRADKMAQNLRTVARKRAASSSALCNPRSARSRALACAHNTRAHGRSSGAHLRAAHNADGCRRDERAVLGVGRRRHYSCFVSGGRNDKGDCDARKRALRLARLRIVGPDARRAHAYWRLSSAFLLVADFFSRRISTDASRRSPPD